MIYTIASKQFYLSPGVTCTCNIPVPDLELNPHQAAGLGKTTDEKAENLEKMLDTMLFPQYVRALTNAIQMYKHSELPDHFLYDQIVIIKQLPVMYDGILGYYHRGNDTIVLDCDSFSIGFKNGSGEFLYGHENGHRILRYKARYKERALKEVKSIVGTSDNYIAEELLCDAFGYLVNPKGKSRLDIFEDISPIKKEGLALAALKLAWR